MELVICPLADSKAIKLTLNNQGKIWEALALTGEELPQALDKLLKTNNIDSTLIHSAVLCAEAKANLTSLRLAKTFQQALSIANALKSKAS